jgi:hypothetical protein
MKEINAILTKEEVFNLKCALGEFRRVTRDQAKPRSDRGHADEMYEAACSLYEKLVETDNR